MHRNFRRLFSNAFANRPFTRNARPLGVFASTAMLYCTSKAFCSSDTPTFAQVNQQVNALPVLYKYTICPFCQRVESYLDYIGHDYEAVEVDPFFKREIKFSEGYKKVPILKVDDALVLTDSRKIIDYITENYLHHHVQVNKTKFLTEDSSQWLDWSENKLAVMLYPNITRTWEECWECFEYVEHVQTWNIFMRKFLHLFCPIAMSFANGKIKKKYGIVDERKELKETLLTWTEALGDKKFLHGNEISLPDIAVFGVLRAIKMTLTYREIMSENPTLRQWYDNVDAQVTSHAVCAIKK